MNANNIKDLEKLLKAFASKRRIAIIQHIRSHKEASVGDISEKIKLSFKTTSKHLGVLLNAGILEREQMGYRANYVISGNLSDSARKILSAI